MKEGSSRRRHLGVARDGNGGGDAAEWVHLVQNSSDLTQRGENLWEEIKVEQAEEKNSSEHGTFSIKWKYICFDMIFIKL